MAKKLNLEEILKNNPRVNADRLQRSRELRKRLRAAGVRGAGYNLALPFERRRVRAGTQGEEDPRTVVVRGSSGLKGK